MNDPVLIEAKKLKAEKGIEYTLKYLAEESSKYTIKDDLCFKYFFKFLDYAFEGGLSECGEMIEVNLKNLFDVLDKNRLFNDNYKKTCGYQFKFYILKEDGNRAMQAANRLSSLLNANPSEYLLICKEINEKAFIAEQFFKVSQNNKDVDYVYRLLMIRFLELGWHIFVDWSINMQALEVNSYGHARIEFKAFEIYNRIKWNINPEETMNDYFEEADILVFERVMKNYECRKTLLLLNDYLFSLFPRTIEFNSIFLELDFTDIGFFGEWFTSIFKHNAKEYSSFIMSQSNRLANNFINKYTK